jgi:hypothetical protein
MSTSKEKLMTEEVNTQEAQVEQKAPAADLNIQDLVGLKSVIDVATQRGAFKAAEMEAVGKLYNKLNNFLESVSNKEPK